MIEKLVTLNHLFFKINSFSKEFLMYAIFSGLALYGLAIYKIAPMTYLQGETIGVVLVPTIAIPGVIFGLPKILAKNTQSTQKTVVENTEDTIEQLIADSSGGEQESLLISPNQNSSDDSMSEIDKLIAEAPLDKEEGMADNSDVQEIINETILPIEKKIGDCQEQLISLKDVKDQISKIKRDVKIVQNSTKLLPEAYRDALVDLKAFQAEIQNPLKFLEKYTDESGIADFTKEFQGAQEVMKNEEKITLDTTYPKDKTKHTKAQMKEKSSFIELLLSKNFTIEEALKFISKHYNAFDGEEGNFTKITEKELYECITEIQVKYGYPIEDLVTELYKLSLIIGSNNQEVDQYYAKILTIVKKTEDEDDWHQ